MIEASAAASRAEFIRSRQAEEASLRAQAIPFRTNRAVNNVRNADRSPRCGDRIVFRAAKAVNIGSRL